jgi:predicted extracellular nuclease
VCNVTTTTVNDAGTTVNDAGSTINVHDAGTTVTDAGTLTDDAGTLVNDAGTATDDAGAMTDDAGTTTDDAGTMEFDAGTFDAGMPVTCAPSVVISQIYGGGGNLSATFKNDFFELHNRTDVAVSLDGWSIQYASFSGTSWKVINLAGPIAANGFFLVGLGNNGGTVGAALPAADLADTTTDISAIHGKVILVSKQTVVSGICPTSDAALVDFVGFGPDQTCAEASSPAPAGGNALAVTRRAISGSSLSCNDSNNNTADFEAATPSPRNSSSSASACTCTQ